MRIISNGAVYYIVPESVTSCSHPDYITVFLKPEYAKGDWKKTDFKENHWIRIFYRGNKNVESLGFDVEQCPNENMTFYKFNGEIAFAVPTHFKIAFNLPKQIEL